MPLARADTGFPLDYAFLRTGIHQVRGRPSTRGLSAYIPSSGPLSEAE